MVTDTYLQNLTYKMGVPGDRPEDMGGVPIFLDGGTIIKSEEEMSVGKNHRMNNGPPLFKYDPANHRAKQEGQGAGGYGW